jgi:hypothetical protein
MKRLLTLSLLLLFSFNTSAKDYACGVMSTDYVGENLEEVILSDVEVMELFKAKCKKGDMLLYRNTSQLFFTSLYNVSARVCDQNKPINVINETILGYETQEKRESLICTYNGSIREVRDD